MKYRKIKQARFFYCKSIVFCILALAYLVSGCSDDLYDDTINQSNGALARKISMNDIQFKSNSNLMKSADILKQIQLNKFNSRYEYNEVYDFYIDQDNGVYFEKDNLESYTFPNL